MKFIAAMDHSGGTTGGVLERYGQEYTEENKMESPCYAYAYGK